MMCTPPVVIPKFAAEFSSASSASMPALSRRERTSWASPRSNVLNTISVSMELNYKERGNKPALIWRGLTPLFQLFSSNAIKPSAVRGGAIANNYLISISDVGLKVDPGGTRQRIFAFQCVFVIELRLDRRFKYVFVADRRREANCFRKVRRQIRVEQTRHSHARNTADIVKTTTYQNPVLRIDRNRPNELICIRDKCRIERTIRIQASDPRAIHIIHSREPAADQDFPAGLNHHTFGAITCMA